MTSSVRRDSKRGRACSNGWTQSNAADALQRLAEASGDEEVGWIVQPFAALDARAGY